MKTRWTLLILILLCAASLFAQEEEQFTPAYKFKNNQKITYDLNLVYKWDPFLLKADNRGEPKTLEQASTRKYTTIFQQTVTGIENGKATLDTKYLKLKSINKKGGEGYLSRTKAVKNKTFTISMTPNGDMTLVKNWQNFNLLSGAVQWAGELKDFVFRMYPTLPAGPVRVGSTWTHEIKGKDIESNEDIVITYKILGQEKYLNRQCLKIEMHGNITSSFRYDDPRGEFFAVTKGKGTIKGICYFDYVKGLLVGFEGGSRKDTTMDQEWILGKDTGHKLTKELTTYIDLSMKLAPPE